MNNKEAIAKIKGMRFQVQSSLDEIEVDVDSKEAEQDNRKIVEAFDMAIKALEQTEKTEEMIYMLLNEADVEANNLKDSKLRYDIGYHDGINFIAHKLEALMRLQGKEDEE